MSNVDGVFVVDKSYITPYNSKYIGLMVIHPTIYKQIGQQRGEENPVRIILQVGGNYGAIYYDDQPHR